MRMVQNIILIYLQFILLINNEVITQLSQIINAVTYTTMTDIFNSLPSTDSQNKIGTA